MRLTKRRGSRKGTKRRGNRRSMRRNMRGGVSFTPEPTGSRWCITDNEPLATYLNQSINVPFLKQMTTTGRVIDQKFCNDFSYNINKKPVALKKAETANFDTPAAAVTPIATITPIDATITPVAGPIDATVTDATVTDATVVDGVKADATVVDATVPVDEQQGGRRRRRKSSKRKSSKRRRMRGSSW